MSELRVAIIGGGGFMGKAHSIAYATSSIVNDLGVDLKKQVLVDANPEIAERAAKQFGWAEWSADWEAVLSRDDIDIIDIVTPPHLHATIALAAIAAGKHVISEKPLTNSAREAIEMAEAAELAGVVAQSGFNYRHIPAITLAKRLISEGKIGEVMEYRSTFTQDANFFSEGGDIGWRGSKKTGGSGSSGDIGSHILDIAEYLNGEIVRVTARARAKGFKRGWIDEAERLEQNLPDDGAMWLAEFANGSIGSFAVNFNASGHKNRLDFEIDGSEGAVKFDWNDRERLDVSYVNDPVDHSGFRGVISSNFHEDVWYGVGGIGLGYPDSQAVMIKRFVRAIVDGTQASPDFTDGAHTQQIVEAIVESSRTGQWVDVPARARVRSDA